MRWLIIILGSLLALGGILYLIGSFLPVKHIAVVKRSFTIKPHELWAILTDFRSYKMWRSGLKSVEAIDHKQWKEESSHGVILYELEVGEIDKQLITRIVSDNLPFGGYWYFQLTETAQGCNLSITENGEVYNPIFRFMSKFMFGQESTVRQYMADLQKHVKQEDL
jgi:hypothetical protein